DTTPWQCAQDHYITKGIALSAFPFGSIGVLPFVNNGGQVILKTAKGHPVVAVKNYGKGRVVSMAYEENGFIPQLKDPWATDLHNEYWEYMWSMVSRAVVWAANRVPESSISAVVFTNSSIAVSLQHAMAGDVLMGEIEDEFGSIEKKFSTTVLNTDSAVTISQLNSLHGGGHIATAYLTRAGKIADWYSFQFTTSHPASIVSINTREDEIPAGQPVQTVVKVQADTMFHGKLLANLYDNYNRLVQQKSMNVQFRDSSSYAFDLDSKNIISHLGRVEFVLMDNNRQADRKIKEIFFLQPRKWDDYDVTLYHFGPNPVPGTWAAIDSQLQNMQVTTLAAYTLEQSRHANYKVQAQTCISGMESPDNGPDLAYYDSIKKKYLETGDKKILVRKYGLNDSSFLHSVKAELNRMVPEWRKFSPSAYYIYEEPSVTRYDDALDLDFSETALAAFRKWLQEKYPSLNLLNNQWGMAFKKWDEVIPDDTKEAQKRGNYSSWADHRSFMEKSWADQFQYVQNALHEIDPEGLVQLSGTQASGAHNGYDYSQIDKYVGQMNPYDIGNQLEYHHDFNPALKISGQAGYGASGKNVLYDFYQHIFVNETGGAYIFWQQSAINPDLTFCKSGQDMKTGFSEMLEKGIGRLVANYTPENENSIAIHYSYPGIHAAWIVDGKIKTGQTYGNTSETLEQFRRNLDGWVKILQDAGLGFDFTSYTGI
ncbi:MAG: beta-galactosidase, partial [Chitinophagaceae bacterium]|nr:beta-galactosidase [Chitinophagaceae bacterium]